MLYKKKKTIEVESATKSIILLLYIIKKEHIFHHQHKQTHPQSVVFNQAKKTFHCSFMFPLVKQLVFIQRFLGSRLKLSYVTKHDFVTKVQYFSSRGLLPFKSADDIPPGVLFQLLDGLNSLLHWCFNNADKPS